MTKLFFSVIGGLGLTLSNEVTRGTAKSTTTCPHSATKTPTTAMPKGLYFSKPTKSPTKATTSKPKGLYFSKPTKSPTKATTVKPKGFYVSKPTKTPTKTTTAMPKGFYFSKPTKTPTKVTKSTSENYAVNWNSIVTTEIGYGCLPVRRCEVKVAEASEACNDGKFLVHRQEDEILCCSLNIGWDTDKRYFDFHGIVEASKEKEVAVVKEGRSSYTASLVGGSAPHEGNVMINGRPVCDDYWDNRDANVVCRMLGYPFGIATTNSEFGAVEENFIMDNVQCSGHENSICDCTHISVHNCAGSEGAGVRCRRTPQVALVGARNDHEGNVMVYDRPVCDDSWDDTDATVVCRMLGYASGSATTQSEF